MVALEVSAKMDCCLQFCIPDISSVSPPVPTAAPRDVAVEVINSTVLRVSWTPVPLATVRGHLGGYNVSLSQSLIHFKVIFVATAKEFCLVEMLCFRPLMQRIIRIAIKSVQAMK